MSWYTYILLCDNYSYYTGITSDLSQRLTSHENKKNIATKEFITIQLVLYEEYATRKSAETREKQIKGWSRAKKKALINGKIDLLVKLSKSRSLLNK